MSSKCYNLTFSLQYVLNVVRRVHNNNHNLATATLATYLCSHTNLILDKNHTTTTFLPTLNVVLLHKNNKNLLFNFSVDDNEIFDKNISYNQFMSDHTVYVAFLHSV